MFIAILELRHFLQHHDHFYLFVVYVGLIWGLWVIKVALSSHYRPWTEPYDTTTSVVIPVVDEPLDLFRDVLHRITEQQPLEVIVVINGPRNPELEEVCDEFAPLVQWTWTPIAGKRNAVMVGTQASRGEIVALVDSDTIWMEGALVEMVKPFADDMVGGVTTRQRILEPKRHFLTRWADWMENNRALYAMPAQSVLGSVGCLPGRTIAFRRHVLLKAMDDFMTQRFLGVFLEVSDDRTLTNLTLKQGYRTVYQSTSLVYTDAPVKMKKLRKQQLRWARGSQYNTARMLPWMLMHTPLLALFFVADIVLPFLLVTVVIASVFRIVRHDGENMYAGLMQMHSHHVSLTLIIAMTFLLSTTSMVLRQLRHVAEVPVDGLLMPVYTMFSTVFLMPLRMLGFLRLGHVGGWGTREAAYSGDSVGNGVGNGAGDGGGTDAQVEGLSGSPEIAARVALVDGYPPQQNPIGDPRALIPYLLAFSVVVLGVMYDALFL